MKTIELSRVHLFDIITQFKAVFPDEDALSKRDGDKPSDSGIFHCWVNQKVHVCGVVVYLTPVGLHRCICSDYQFLLVPPPF